MCQTLFGWLQYSLLQVTAEKLGYTLRAKYLSSLMKQETAYFESAATMPNGVQALPAHIQELFTDIPEAVGAKFSQVLKFAGMMVSGLAICFVFAPGFGGLLIVYIPLVAIAITIYGALTRKQIEAKQKQNEKLGAYTEEILSALKLVISFGNEEAALKEYSDIASET